MPRRPKSTQAHPPDDVELVLAARRFNATGAIWPSAVLGTRRQGSAGADDLVDRLFQIHDRSCRVLDWHLRGATRRHSNALKVVTSFVGGVCNPAHSELAALGALWSLPESRRRHIQSAFEDLARRLASVLETGRSAGEIRGCDCLIAAQLILGLVLWTPVAVSQATPRKLLNGRRLVEALQDLLVHGRTGGNPEAHRMPPQTRSPSLGFAAQGDPLRLLVSRTINRAGAEAVTAAHIAAELPCSEAEAAAVLRRPWLIACQQRTIALVLEIRDDAFTTGDEPGPGFAAFMEGLAEAYLRDDVQPLSPLALPLSASAADPVRMRWQTTWDLLRQRQVDGVAKDEVRERFHDLSPIFASAICAFLCSGLWAPGAQEIRHAVQEVAALAWLGLAPPARS
jgi:hypothetical protein